MTPRERFEALPEATKQEILDKHRYRDTEHHEWWDGVYEQFKEKMNDLGIIIHTRTYNSARGKACTEDAIYFSGFGCQGDGACFNGEIGNYAKVYERHSPLLLEHILKIGYCSISWTSTGRDCHSYSLVFSDVFEICEPDCEGLRLIAHEQLIEELKDEWEKFKEAIEHEVRGFCDQLYSDLEDENDYLTSDESVLESLDANDELEEILSEIEAEHE